VCVGLHFFSPFFYSMSTIERGLCPPVKRHLVSP